MSKEDRGNAAETVVRHYFSALDHGRVLEALNDFSMDARMRDERGRERRGIREIAAAFATREVPLRVDVEELEREGEAVTVRVRMTFPETGEPRAYRSVFRVDRNRIHSVVTDPLPGQRPRGRASPPS